jgi:hypothetical protein
MLDLPTYAYPFILAVLAAIVGKMVPGNVDDEPGAFARGILYALAVTCVVVGVVAIWLKGSTS